MIENGIIIAKYHVIRGFNPFLVILLNINRKLNALRNFPLFFIIFANPIYSMGVIMKRYKLIIRIETHNQKYEAKFVPEIIILIKSSKYGINVNGAGSLINAKK
jgi:hypothetical protein